MKTEKRNLVVLSFLIAILVLAIPAGQAAADIGPTPSLRLVFDKSGLTESQSVKDIVLYTCSEADCSDREELIEVPGQHFECFDSFCQVDLMSSRDYFQVGLLLGEKPILSDVFMKEGFYSTYDLVFYDDRLEVALVSAKELVKETPESGPDLHSTNPLLAEMLGAGFFTLIIESIFGFLLLLITRGGGKNIIWILIGNMITIPIVWLALPQLSIPIYFFAAAVFSTAACIEALLLRWKGGEKMPWWKAWLISILINIASTLFGVFVIS